MIPFDADVCIVGGGPAGVIAAHGIAKAGYSVVILDKKSRNKIADKNCGDALDGLHVDLIQKNMGIQPPSIETGEARELINKITFAVENLETKFTALTPGYLVDRLKYGQRLLNDVETMGVEIRADCKVRELIIEDNFIRGVSYFNELGEKQQLRAKITIDASGYSGVVRRQIPKELSNNINYDFTSKYTIATYREIIKFKSEKDHNFREEILILYHKDIPPPGYAWIFSEGQRMLNIGIAWVKSTPYPKNKSMKQLYHDILDPYFNPDDYDIIHKGGGNIPMRPNFDSLVTNGCIITGDAAGLADPTTFEGHGPALESGRLASIASINALKENNYSLDVLWTYNKAIMDYPGGMHTQSFLAAKLLSEIGSAGLYFLLNKEIITESELRAIFQEKNTTMSMGKKIFKFLKAFPKWGTMLKIKKYLDLIEKAEEIYQAYPSTPDGLSKWISKRNKKLNLVF